TRCNPHLRDPAVRLFHRRKLSMERLRFCNGPSYLLCLGRGRASGAPPQEWCSRSKIPSSVGLGILRTCDADVLVLVPETRPCKSGRPRNPDTLHLSKHALGVQQKQKSKRRDVASYVLPVAPRNLARGRVVRTISTHQSHPRRVFRCE